MILVENLSSIILFVVKAVDIFNLKNISDRNINAYKKNDIMIRIKGGNLSGKVQAITYLPRHCTIAEIAKQLNRHKSS